MEFFMGGIVMFGGSYSPSNWSFCNGQTIAISQNTTLYSILGNIWGGDGRVNFALPDLRSRVPVGFGRGVNLTERNLGSMYGDETQAMRIEQMPAHSHTISVNPGSWNFNAQTTVKASDSSANQASPANNYWAIGSAMNGRTPYPVEGYSGTADAVMASDAVEVSVQGQNSGIAAVASQTGAGQPFSIIPPMLAMNYIIAVEGPYPTRN